MPLISDIIINIYIKISIYKYDIMYYYSITVILISFNVKLKYKFLCKKIKHSIHKIYDLNSIAN